MMASDDQPRQNLPAAPGPAGDEERMDVANRSLADALRLSFRLLSIIMVIVLAALLLTGLSKVQPYERGVRMLFGRIQGEGSKRVLSEGLRWSWPEPIGRVMKVPTGQRKLPIEEFWYHETKATKEAEEMPIVQNVGLRPGWDGALLTGDRALLHVKFTCNYKYGARAGQPDADEIINFISNPADAEEMVRSAVCNAAIRAAATRTVDSILTTGQEGFRRAVEQIAQRRLDVAQSGIMIESIQLSGLRVPLAATAAFNAVTRARQSAEAQINKAIGEANSMLERTAGDTWETLVGQSSSSEVSGGLLPMYARARESGDEQRARDLLERINRTLISNKTKGTAAEIIYDAKKYSNSIRQRVAARAWTFEHLVDKFDATPDLMLQRLWAEVKEEILSSPLAEKYYLTHGPKTNMLINQDPAVRQRLTQEYLKAKEQGQGSGRRGQ